MSFENPLTSLLKFILFSQVTDKKTEVGHGVVKGDRINSPSWISSTIPSILPLHVHQNLSLNHSTQKTKALFWWVPNRPQVPLCVPTAMLNVWHIYLICLPQRFFWAWYKTRAILQIYNDNLGQSHTAINPVLFSWTFSLWPKCSKCLFQAAN